MQVGSVVREMVEAGVDVALLITGVNAEENPERLEE